MGNLEKWNSPTLGLLNQSSGLQALNKPSPPHTGWEEDFSESPLPVCLITRGGHAGCPGRQRKELCPAAFRGSCEDPRGMQRLRPRQQVWRQRPRAGPLPTLPERTPSRPREHGAPCRGWAGCTLRLCPDAAGEGCAMDCAWKAASTGSAGHRALLLARSGEHRWEGTSHTHTQHTCTHVNTPLMDFIESSHGSYHGAQMPVGWWPLGCSAHLMPAGCQGFAPTSQIATLSPTPHSARPPAPQP